MLKSSLPLRVTRRYTLFWMISNATDGWNFRNKQFQSLAIVSTNNSSTDTLPLKHDFIGYKCYKSWKLTFDEYRSCQAEWSIQTTFTAVWRPILYLLLSAMSEKEQPMKNLEFYTEKLCSTLWRRNLNVDFSAFTYR